MHAWLARAMTPQGQTVHKEPHGKLGFVVSVYVLCPSNGPLKTGKPFPAFVGTGGRRLALTWCRSALLRALCWRPGLTAPASGGGAAAWCPQSPARGPRGLPPREPGRLRLCLEGASQGQVILSYEGGWGRR